MTRSANVGHKWAIDHLVCEIAALPPQVVRHLVHQLIDFLDEQDGDPDLEDGGDQEFIDENEPEDWAWPATYPELTRSFSNIRS